MEIKPFCGITKKCKNKKLCHFLFQLIILGCFGQEEFIIFFSRTFHKYLKKTVRNKLAFKNVLFIHNSACVTQKWLRFKRVTTV